MPAADYERADAVIGKSKDAIGYEHLDGSTDVAKVSVIGIGMRSHAGVAAKAFKALSEQQINIRAITTSEIKFSLLIDAAYTELAVRTLHSPLRPGQVSAWRSALSPTRSASRTSISGARWAMWHNGFYVDIGGGHPVYDNVSFAFYLAGWRGIVGRAEPGARRAHARGAPAR